MLQALWMPKIHPEIVGLSKRTGEFWITYNGDEMRGTVCIRLTVPADGSRNYNGASSGYFASLHAHHDGISVLSDLYNCNFTDRFREIGASTFYDVMQCLILSGIPVQIQGQDDSMEFMNRKMYELLHGKNEDRYGTLHPEFNIHEPRFAVWVRTHDESEEDGWRYQLEVVDKKYQDSEGFPISSIAGGNLWAEVFERAGEWVQRALVTDHCIF